ncbi:hypothetical protein J3Q64DRAFT_1725414 [Phycomyces blakesleeanus]|uniref:Probable RNA polymerase II nuclear localization protein SLC7A6OS n=2 Tax=Phycomyces blakesleeanus TaxID=4837 RepID=A0A163BCX9_PHYB8|nr:hypothetical protein PHYBLDRAFT_161361 [Phycomyces blakesleeanus NRRL 1555(-)]OAD80721.1 hypothetical protein PHYBLDRAFT_161361 [Phycomyces blakesleeanus NRRL 1555(-)]|eukprot:XP_018298761.1 hypothetical protein PHYBLDRAFT_161361 [Phycomyces blakesleeanus NRRL 1555(-)]
MSKPEGTSIEPQLTILRIKRKRTEEPLDALLVQQDKDKRVRRESNAKTDPKITIPASALPTLFRLAETVEEKSFKSIAEAQKLKDRISRRIQPGGRPMTPESSDDRKDRMMKEQLNTNRQARYRVVQQNRSKNAENLPPMVESASEVAAKDLFQMYEAVKEDDKENSKAKLFMDDDTEDPDDIMCNFIPMVKEYLTLNEKPQLSEEDEYVYDVYYRDDSNVTTGINAANIGSLVWFDEQGEFLNDDTDSELGDHEDEDSNAEDYYQNDYPDEESVEDYEHYHGSGLSSDEYDLDDY